MTQALHALTLALARSTHHLKPEEAAFRIGDFVMDDREASCKVICPACQEGVVLESGADGHFYHGASGMQGMCLASEIRKRP